MAARCRLVKDGEELRGSLNLSCQKRSIVWLVIVAYYLKQKPKKTDAQGHVAGDEGKQNLANESLEKSWTMKGRRQVFQEIAGSKDAFVGLFLPIKYMEGMAGGFRKDTKGVTFDEARKKGDEQDRIPRVWEGWCLQHMIQMALLIVGIIPLQKPQKQPALCHWD